MKFITLQFRNKNREIGFIINNSGITISSIQGIEGTLQDILTTEERNYLIITILTNIER